MSFSEDIVISKFSTLNETQDSIVSISQWIMFHRRYAQQTADIWAKYINGVAQNRKLSLIYLANEVVQQSRAKKKDEFVNAFARALPQPLAEAHRTASPEVKSKIKRVVDVWAQRQIFPDNVLKNIQNAMDKNNSPVVSSTAGSNSLGLLGDLGLDLGSLGTLGASIAPNGSGASSNNSSGASSNIPSSLSKLVVFENDLIKASDDSSTKIASSYRDYSDLFDSDALPAPKIYLSKLADLTLSLNSASLAAKSVLETRKSVIAQLKSLVDSNESLLREDQSTIHNIDDKLIKVYDTSKEIQGLVDEENTEQENNKPHDLQPVSLASTQQSQQEDDADDDAVPTYSPLSSDDEHDKSPQKKPKTDNVNVDDGDATKGLEELDPAVSAFLNSLITDSNTSLAG